MHQFKHRLDWSYLKELLVLEVEEEEWLEWIHLYKLQAVQLLEKWAVMRSNPQVFSFIIIG